MKTLKVELQIYLVILVTGLATDEAEMAGFEHLSPEQEGSPVEPSYMSDYEAISSEDELIDIDTDLVSSGFENKKLFPSETSHRMEKNLCMCLKHGNFCTKP